ncbi:MAG TPA: hypothetical protein VMT38_13375 [Terracidiphilus sp.]|nr:hypothetical protein [Terracidiphilus sp.]
MEWMRIISGRSVLFAAIALACSMAPAATSVHAQSNPAETKSSEPNPAPLAAPETVRTFFLVDTERNDFNDIQTDLRNVVPRAKIYGIQTENAITIRATAEDMQTAQALISDLDKPRKLYRLTFTITDIDGGKRVGSQQFTLLVSPGEKSTFKQGSRVPITTGTIAGQPEGTQMQYQDIGLHIEAYLSGSPDAINLRTKVEQSSLAEDRPATSAQDPVVRQTALDESAVLSQGKPQVLGSLDIPGTARSQEIQVMAELVR